MKVAIYGTGYVGLVTGACLAELGHEVLCIDIDQTKISALAHGCLPFYEVGLAELVGTHLASARLSFSSKIASGVIHADVLFLCVGTPTDALGAADLSGVYAVAEVIAKHMAKDCIIVTKSTVPVGTAANLHQFIAKHRANKHTSAKFAIVSNPEFLREGKAVYDFMHPCRIIIGTDDTDAGEVMRQLYAPLCGDNCPLLLMDSASAELSKYAANAMLATRISFINEMAHIAQHTGGDIKQVEQAMACDPRIGQEYISAGCGYGGSCFPKDLAALMVTAKQANYQPKLLPAVEQVNQAQQQWLFQQITTHFGDDLTGYLFAIWGLAFKPGTDDMRDAPSRPLMAALWSAGAKIRAYDPAAMSKALDCYGQRDDLYLCDTALACSAQADALIIVTEWPEFLSPDFTALKAQLKQAVIFDGRNIYSSQHLAQLGFQYYGVGRGNILSRRGILDQTLANDIRAC